MFLFFKSIARVDNTTLRDRKLTDARMTKNPTGRPRLPLHGQSKPNQSRNHQASAYKARYVNGLRKRSLRDIPRIKTRSKNVASQSRPERQVRR